MAKEALASGSQGIKSFVQLGAAKVGDEELRALSIVVGSLVCGLIKHVI